ncbi:Nitroalkane oxidase [Cladophialophora carrionii]|uniref:Nitroalkane oxidase n=1 Tax=Cladophialophora carrionii TaxID=86049 RepID=A0A1C1CWM6_9EURO|nr:Nitroalkane oxidase [Cladophialophora carrionii]
MIDFELSQEQLAVRNGVRGWAKANLTSARSVYEGQAASTGEWRARFRSTRPIYAEAVKAGLIKAQIPKELGGAGGPLIEAALVVEEFYAVETSASLTILGTGLGLTPLIMAGSSEQHQKFFKPFFDGIGTPLASLVFSEPGGSANFAEEGSPGFQTVARAEGDEYVINGDKIWATNSSGWDDRGADVQCVLARVVGSAPAGDVRGQTAIIIVTREDIATNDPGAYQVLYHPESIGHTAVNGPHIRFKDLRVPKTNLLAPPGKGADVVEMTFTASACLVGAMGVGIMRQTFERALAWAKTEKRGSKETMLKKQSVADLLIKIKTRCEAARALVWKAAHAFGRTQYGAELCYEAKIFGSESAVESVMDAINLIGVSAYSRKQPFGDLLNDAVVLPIFDGGNVGVRRRQIEAIFLKEGYDPWETTYGADERGPAMIS